MGAARIFCTSAWQLAGSKHIITSRVGVRPSVRTEVCLAVFQVITTGRGRIFSKEDVESGIGER